jgi:hypothetical protein
VPTLSPLASNYATLNPLYVHYPWTASVPTNGNLFNPAGSHSVAVATQALSGKMYWEVSIGNPNQIVGIINQNSTYTGTYSYDDPSAKGIYTYTIDGYINGSGIQSPGGPIGSQSGAHTYMFAVDIPNGLMWAGINGTFNGNPSAGTGAFWTNLLSTIQYSPWIHSAATNESNTANVNFGQRPFAYTPPTGFKSLNAFNLP